MTTPSIPPYKPPKELQYILDKQGAQRKRTAQLPKRNWIYRNPKKFQITFMTVSLLVFFSRPLYDAFLSDLFPGLEDPRKFLKRD